MSHADSTLIPTNGEVRAHRLEVEDAFPAGISAAGKSSSRLRFAAPWLLVALVVLVFMPALQAGLIFGDDEALLLTNTRYQSLSAANLRWMFTTSYAGHFQPLTWLSYWLDYAIWRGNPFGYHMANVVLHAGNAVVFYFVVRMLLVLARRDPESASTRPFVLSAAFAACLFAIHPLRAESVAWVTERRDVLSGLFYLGSIAWYLRYTARRQEHRRIARGHQPGFHPRVYYLAALAMCGLSLLAKASAMTLPVVLLVLDVFPLRRVNPSLPARREKRAFLFLEKAPFFLLAAGAGFRAVLAQQQARALYFLADHDVVARCAQACYGLVFYVQKTLLPSHLGPLYEIPARETLLGPMWWISAAVICAVAIAAVRVRHRYPGVPTALVVYAVVLSPVLGFVQSGPQLVADRYSYLSCLSFAALAGGMLLQWMQTDWWKVSSSRRALVTLAAVLWASLLARTAFAQADYWQQPIRLWRRGVQVSPNSPIAQVNYADALARLGRTNYGVAATHYRRALELNPRDPVALHHFGSLLQLAGEKEQALRLYLASLRIDPDRRSACFALARLLREQGHAGAAAAVLHDGLRRHPDDGDMMGYLADLLATTPDATVRNGTEAAKWATRVSAARRNLDPATLLTLATALAEMGRFEEAVKTAEKSRGLAQARDDRSLLSEVDRRLLLFRDRVRFHEKN